MLIRRREHNLLLTVGDFTRDPQFDALIAGEMNNLHMIATEISKFINYPSSLFSICAQHS
jgi:hypothetical protein